MMKFFFLAVAFLLLVLYSCSCPIHATPTTPVEFSSSSSQSPYCLDYNSTSNLYSVNVCPSSINLKNRDSFGFTSTSSLRGVASFSINSSTAGWDFLEIMPNLEVVASSSSSSTSSSTTKKGNDNDVVMMNEKLRNGYYYAGFLEGYLSAVNLTQINVSGRSGIVGAASTDALNFITDHVNWMNSTAASYYSSSSSSSNMTAKFWNRVGMILNQIQGMTDGYNAYNQEQGITSSSSSSSKCSFLDMFLVSFYFESLDIAVKFGVTFNFDPSMYPSSTSTSAKSSSQVDEGDQQQLPKFNVNSHCSAMIKLTHDDLYVAHTSWFSFQTMRRVFKTYHFDTSVTFSAYVGTVSSGDDWYMNYPSELAVFETSLTMTNPALLPDLISSAVSEFVRVMVANYLSSTTDDWGFYFSQHNNGAYNNMFVATDWKLFTPSSSSSSNNNNNNKMVPLPVLPNKTVQIYEQIPGTVTQTDVSEIINANGYFASYNVAYNKNIWKQAGYEALYNQYGDFFSYENTTRANIFRRNQSSCNTLTDVQNLLRYNNYKYDPLSRIPNCTGTTSTGGTQNVSDVCSPAYSSNAAIACRGDLAPTGNETTLGPLFAYFNQADHSATDTKIASYKNRKTLKAIIISGPPTTAGDDLTPTTSPLPPFTFSANAHLFPAGAILPPAGVPDTWNFPWVAKSPACPSCVDFNGNNNNNAPNHHDLWADKQSVGAMIGGVLGIIGILLVVVYLKRTRVVNPNVNHQIPKQYEVVQDAPAQA